MEKIKSNIDLTAAYGIQVEYLNSRDKALPATFMTRAIISAGQKTKLHAHFEKEQFVVLSGRGRVRALSDKSSVSAAVAELDIQQGDLVEVNAFSAHEILNLEQGDLEILSLTSTQKDRPALPESMLITTAPPTPNGPLHLGHASGPYLGADLLARYLRKRQVAVNSIFYTDDHQNYVNAKADSQNRDPNEVAAQYREEILQGLRGLGAETDELLDVNRNVHYKLNTQLLFESLLEKGVVELVDTSLPYCLHCQEILIDATLSGTCPHCSQSSSGSCENCGHYSSAAEIENPHCAKCHIQAHRRNAVVARLNLEPSRNFIKSYLEKTHMNARAKERLRTVLEKPLPHLIVSHPGSYGIAVQHEKLLGQVFHVWFEMAAGMDFIRKKSKSQQWAHFFGFDNAFYYALAIPAILEAHQKGYPHADYLYANEFLELEGKKFSTSRSHALWVNEEIFRMGKDFLRMALHYQSPQNSPSSVSLEALLDEKKKILFQLDKMLGISDLVKDAAPVRLTLLNNEEKDFYINTHLRVREAEESLHPLYFNRRTTVRSALRLMLEIEDFKKDFYRSAQGLSLLRMALQALGQIMELLAPDFASKLAERIPRAKNWNRDFV